MRSIIEAGVDTEAFLMWAARDGYSMQDPFMRPVAGEQISHELDINGYLVDYTELIDTTVLAENGMWVTQALHAAINTAICEVEGQRKNHIPLFSVRVFEPGVHGTTIHRNDPSIGPWAVGITLKGEAPFNVYEQEDLPDYQTIPLKGDGTDPEPMDTMDAHAGAAWALYTENELVPHASGLVHSATRRELLIFYGFRE